MSATKVAPQYTAQEKAVVAILESAFKQAKVRYYSGEGDADATHKAWEQAAVNLLRFRAAVEARCAGKPKPKQITRRDIANLMR